MNHICDDYRKFGARVKARVSRSFSWKGTHLIPVCPFCLTLSEALAVIIFSLLLYLWSFSLFLSFKSKNSDILHDTCSFKIILYLTRCLQKLSDTLELEFQMVISNHVSAGDKGPVQEQLAL